MLLKISLVYSCYLIKGNNKIYIIHTSISIVSNKLHSVTMKNILPLINIFSQIKYHALIIGTKYKSAKLE